jgi:excinuclease ABC subunit A
MSVEEATGFFLAHPKIHHALTLLKDVGLGYLTLGQSSPSLSGGEAQRIKLVTELAKVNPVLINRRYSRSDSKATIQTKGPREHTLYILDEPTIGLHMADVERLIRVLHRLVDAGHTILLIEHNLDLIAEADWLIDLGPGGGEQGGRLLLAGPPEKFIHTQKKSSTALALKEFLVDRWHVPATSSVRQDS